MGHYNMEMTVVWELQQLRGILGTLQTTTPLMHFWVDHVLSDLGTLLVGQNQWTPVPVHGSAGNKLRDWFLLSRT